MYCKNWGNVLDSNSKFCSSCGAKHEIQNVQLNNANSKKKDKLTKILGICTGTSFGLFIIILFLGVILCFQNPQTGDNISGLTFDLFGECAGTMIVISVVLVILIVILSVIKSNKNKRSC